MHQPLREERQSIIYRLVPWLEKTRFLQKNFLCFKFFRDLVYREDRTKNYDPGRTAYQRFPCHILFYKL